MKNLVFGMIWLVLLSSCARKLPTPTSRNTPSFFKLTSIKADNISEEVTGNDEIHLMAWLVKDSIPNRFIIRENQDTADFDKSDLSKAKILNFQYPLTSLDQAKTILALVVVESDTEILYAERTGLVRKELLEANFQDSDSLQARLARALGDDDLLFLSFYKLSNFKQSADGQIGFTGIHLFDKYFYRITYRFE